MKLRSEVVQWKRGPQLITVQRQREPDGSGDRSYHVESMPQVRSNKEPAEDETGVV